MHRILLPLVLLSGCTWISQSDVDRRLEELDDDGDGFPRDGDDCDDADASIYLGAPDEWYDGIDSDCAEDDDYDADGDGVRDPSGDGGTDCDDADASIYPGATDDWYDGVDNDCGGEDDYDADFDGYQDASSPNATPADTDCDDTDATINPGARDDWYDGVDNDCGGEDDYDKDGDGYQDASSPDATPLTADCDDEDDTIYPSATDAWYDGIDSDCAGDDDYDADLDGVRHVSSGDALVDCDDDDATAYPDNDEDVTDGVDHDCDGGADSFEGVTLDWALDGANNARFVADADSLYLSIVTLEADDGGTVWNDQGLAFVIPQTDPRATPELLNWYASVPDDRGYIFTTGQSILLDDTTLFGAVGYLVIGKSSSNRYLQIAAYDDSLSDPRKVVPYPYPGGMDADFSDIAFGADSEGGLHAFGCTRDDGGNLQYMRTTAADLQAGSVLASFVLEGVEMGPCSVYFDNSGFGGTPQGLLGFQDEATDEYVIWSFDPTDTPPSVLDEPEDYFVELQRSSDYSVIDLEYPRLDIFTEVFIDDGVGVVIREGLTTATVAPTAPPINANTLIHDDLWYVAWADTDGNVGVTWGDLDGGFTDTAWMSLDFVAEEAVVQVTDDGATVLVGAISAEQIAVGHFPTP